MRYLKKFENFEMAEPMVKPSPITKPAQPTTKPGTKPNRPSPLRRDRPSVDPNPKAKLSKASEEAVANRFVELSQERGEDIKKYYN
jgi:hypothetical protein